MLNEVVLIGKITKLNLYLKDDKKVVDLTIATPKNHKVNEADLYDCDLFSMQLVGSTAISTAKFCEVDDVIGIKGRLANQEGEIVVVPLKITTLSNEIKCKENETC